MHSMLYTINIYYHTYHVKVFKKRGEKLSPLFNFLLLLEFIPFPAADLLACPDRP
jgi:hypothetical protein